VPVDRFGEPVASTYDASLADLSTPAAVDPVVEHLVRLAAGGAAVEFGIGTGRIAIPLQRRGVVVHGIDLSAAMVARLRAKPGGEHIPVVIGDFATARAGEGFTLAYLVFNTVMNLTTQDEQVECFSNAARHLAPGGCFVVEVMVPRLRRLPPGETAQPFHVSDEALGFDIYDVAGQGLVSHHFERVDGRWESTSTPFRYVWAAELDLMARLAGLRLEARWAGWRQEPFTGESDKHVSVWQKPAA
jgi:SAM-dependent methyltransferase